MSRRERILGRLATLGPNRKFDATRHVALDSGLVDAGADRRFVRANAAFVWTYYLRFARLATTGSRRRALEKVVSAGAHNLQAATAKGHGVILLSVHLGDFDVAGAWLTARCGVTPVVVARPVLPRWREAMFTTVRRRCGVVMRDATRTSLADLEGDLGQRRAILVMLDRRPPGLTATSTMLGRPAVAPLGMAMLAARTKAPMLPAATWRNERGEIAAWFGEPVTVESQAEGVAAIVNVAERLSAMIRSHPEQWHVPCDVNELAWSSGVDAGEGALSRSGRVDHVPVGQDA